MAALALAAVLVVAAAAKLRRPAATADDFASLGLRHSKVLARLVPAVEVATALALVVARPWGATVAFALLVAFTVVLATVVRSGRVVTCSCFGGATGEPVSPRTLARNGVLLALAVVAFT
ncbi:MAG: MauE/DoxX family redox-associated membrane protein [Acidimicrobiales bacterium]